MYRKWRLKQMLLSTSVNSSSNGSITETINKDIKGKKVMKISRFKTEELIKEMESEAKQKTKAKK